MKTIKQNIKMSRKWMAVICLIFCSAICSELLAQARPNVDVPYGFHIGSYSGGLNYKREDILIPGNEPELKAEFSYNSMEVGKDLGYGPGWSMNYDFRYEVDTLDVVIVYKSDGSTHRFSKNDGGYIAPQGSYDLLEEYQAGKFRLSERKEKLVYYFENQTHRKLTKIENLQGQKLQMTYADTLLSKVEDHTGRKLSYVWSNGRLLEVQEANTGNSRSFKYRYDAKGRLTKVTNPEGDFLNYAYDSKGYMTGFADENGSPLTFIYNSSWAVKKVTTCQHTIEFTYDLTNRKTFVLENLGGERVITTFHYDEQGRNIQRKGNCCGLNQTMKYDDHDNVIAKTDGNGDSYSFLFDELGNVKKKINPEGFEVKFVYDQTLNKIKSFTDQLGYQTTYDYDASGNVIKVNYPLNLKELYSYDANGRIISSTDRNGNATTYEYDQYGYPTKIIHPDNSFILSTYDEIGNLLSETDENGNETVFEYDLMNRLVKAIDAKGKSELYAFDGKQNVLEVTNRRNDKISFHYDPLDRLLSSISAGGITTSTEYDNRGNPIVEVDGNGIKTKYTYNEFDLVVTKIDALGNSIAFDYDAVGRKTSQTDKLGNSMTFEYSSSGRLIKKTDPLGNSMLYKYDAKGRKLVETDGEGNSNYAHYDEMDRIVKRVDALGNEELFEFDGIDNVIKKTDKNANITTYEYDLRGRRIKTHYPLNYTVEFSFDAVGNEVSKTLASGFTQTFEFDELNQQLKKTLPSGKVVLFEYDEDGNQTKITYTNGNIETRSYDKDSRIVEIKDSEGLLAKYTYDRNGNQLTSMNADSVLTTYSYDGLNRRIRDENEAGGVAMIEYNVNGLPISSTDELGRKKTFTYNEIGIPVQSTDANGGITSFTFSPMGNILSMTDQSGNVTGYEYDKLNRKIATNYPNGTVKEYVYDGNSNITQRVYSDGSVSKYDYDALDRRVKKTYPDQTTSSYTYDALSRLTRAKNQNADITFEFNSDNQLIKETIDGGDATEYQYGASGKEKTITYPGGRVVVEKLDYRGKPTEISNNGSNLMTASYGGNRMLQQTYSNGIQTDFGYNENGNLNRIKVGVSLFDLEYNYDISNRRNALKKAHNEEFSEIYSYDSNDRLLSFSKGEAGEIPVRAVVFEYDKTGNRTSEAKDQTAGTYETNEMNEYVSLETNGTTREFQYSECGTLMSDGVHQYNYDSDNRLIKVDASTTYLYDALGRRYQKNVGGTITTFFYYEDQLIQEKTGSDRKDYIYLGNNDRLVATASGSTVHFYHLDVLNSVMGITDQNGDLIEQYEYDPFGKVTIYDSLYQVQATSSIDNHFFFTGRELDEESGLYYFRSRHYDPVLGRFLQRDPLEFDAGNTNIYEYVGSNPMNYIDPSGLKACVTVGNSYSYDATRFLQRAAFGARGLLKASGKISVSFESKTCEKCCPNGYKGSITTVETKISGGGSLELNALSLFPASRVIVIAARRLGVEVFAGLIVSGSVSGSVTRTFDCGDQYGSGCVTFSASSTAQLHVKSINSGALKGSPASFNVGGSISGIYESKGCVYFNNSGSKKECSTTIKAEGKAWAKIEFSWSFFKYTLDEEWKWEIANSKSNACPPGL